jgi:hypothetical protein
LPAAGLLDEPPPAAEEPPDELGVLLELLEQAARAIGMAAATVMPAIRPERRYVIRSS